jgi:hypothetical protein
VKVYRLYLDVPDLDDAQWLYTTPELAKASAEKAVRDNIEFVTDTSVIDGEFQFIWKQEQELRPTQESIEKGEKPPVVDVDAWKLYYKTAGIPEQETAYIVEPVEVYEAVNF